jgi:hypothetical protein
VIVNNYKENGKLPSVGYDAMRWGRWPKVQKEDIPSLNNVLHQNIGMVAGTSTLTRDILDLSSQQDKSTARNCTTETSIAFEPGTLALDQTISLVKNSSTKCQGTICETATKSQRNVHSWFTDR